ELLGGLQPGDPGHLDVEQGHVRPRLAVRNKPLLAAGHLPPDLKVRLQRQQRRQRAPDHRLILGEQDPGHWLETGMETFSRNPPPGAPPASSLPRRRSARSLSPVNPCPAPSPSDRSSSQPSQPLPSSTTSTAAP